MRADGTGRGSVSATSKGPTRTHGQTQSARRFRTDNRGRIPFAFLGALLLLTSTLYASASAPAPVAEPVTDEVVDEAQRNARLAIATAIRGAGREAARRPVLEPADSPMGRVIGSEDPFERYLRLLIAVETRDALDHADASSEGIDANVSLPPLRDVDDTRSAVANVTITERQGPKYRIRIKGLTVRIRRHGRVADRSTYNMSLTMRLPVRRLHDRTQRFESRLQAGVTQSGFARDLTTRLYAITWTRGYAQYGGAPIANVLANRHIEVMANDAILAQQEAVFGAEHERGRRLTRRAGTDVALRDGFRGAEEHLKSSVSTMQEDKESDTEPGGETSVPTPSVYGHEQSYDLDHTADKAFLAFVDGADDPDLETVLDRVYRASVRASGRSRLRGRETTRSGTRPRNGTLVYTATETDRWLQEGSWTRRDSGSTLSTFDGKVVEERVTTRYWVQNRTLSTTSVTRQRTHQVGIDVECRHRPPGLAPAGSSPRCPFGGSVRDTLTDRSTEAVLSGRGDIEELAVDAVQGGAETDWTRVDIDPPARVRKRAYDRTADLRKAAADVSVTMKTRSVASSANPASRLRDTLENRRDRILDPPTRYGSAGDRAVTAARAVFFRHLLSRLDSESPLVHRAQQTLASRLQDHAIPTSPPEDSTTTLSGIASGIDADPAYLSIADNGGGQPAMAARNVNIFAVPYGDAADTVTSELGIGGDTVSLRTAAQTLDATRSAAEDEGQSGAEIEDLGEAVESSVAHAKTAYISAMDDHVSRRQARRWVSRAYDRFDDDADRALAITDGRMTQSIRREAAGKLPERTLDRMAVELRVAGKSLREEPAVRIDQPHVETAMSTVDPAARDLASEGIKQAGTAGAKRAWKRATSKTATGLPAGLPLLPMPGSWYATANAWVVSVQGSYDRFTVRSRRASPGRAENGTIEYVRADEEISRDIDGDGREERLGRNRPLKFAADTGVLVVVPPGGTGVGDVDGNVDERSPGWDG